MMRAWMSGERVRAFVAVDLVTEVVRRVAEAQRLLHEATARAGWRVGWVSPTQMHLTLKFLGDVRREVIEALRDRLAVVAAARPAFDVEVRGVGSFPDLNSPRVLWVGMRDEGGALSRLHGDAEAALSDLGFAREKRAFHAHVTLGRVKEAPGGGAEILAPHAETSFGVSTVREVVLVQSVLKRSGAEYLSLARAPLQASRRAERGESKEREHEG